MKKICFLIALLPLCTITISQISYSFWQFLPADFEENPYQRQIIMVQPANDDLETSFNSLEELWNVINNDFIYPIESVTNYNIKNYINGIPMEVIAPEQSSGDYSGSFTLISNNEALYALYKVIDDEVNSNDNVEIHFAPYVEKFDPGRTIFTDVSITDPLGGIWWADSLSHVWGWDPETESPLSLGTVIKGKDYIEMSKYGSWTEVGANKVALTLASSIEVYPPTINYTMKGEKKDTLGDLIGGALTSPMKTLYEPTANGYYFLAIIPWDIMPSGKLLNTGDQISIALKVNDYDSDNFKYTDLNGVAQNLNYNIWGGTDNNDAYWAIAYYGAIAELSDKVLSNNKHSIDNLDAYLANNILIINSSTKIISTAIYDINGAVRGQFKENTQIDLSYLNNGFYSAYFTDNHGNNSVFKFTKTNN